MNVAPRRVAVVGGGISGLAAAHAIVEGVRGRKGAVALTLFESGSRVGGNISTEHRDGFLLDGGPDSWVRAKPAASALATRVALGAELIGTNEATRHVYVEHHDELVRIPEGLVLAIPTRLLPVATTRLFSLRAKARMALEPFVARACASEDAAREESVGEFMTRRLGAEVTARLAAPMLGGIFAGDVAKLSVRAAFPQLVAMENAHGSLVRGMRAARAQAKATVADGEKAPSAFTSLRGGVGSLIDALFARLAVAPDVAIRFQTEVVRISPLQGSEVYALTLRSGEVVFFDEVVVATPAYAAASALRELDGAMSRDLDAIPYVSTATAFYAFHRRDVVHALDAVGFVVPRRDGRPLLASTWVSSKWENRAPRDHVLIRAFFGGAWGEEILSEDDDVISAVGLKELAPFMGFRRPPRFARVFRFPRKMPQPVVGHLARVERIRERVRQHPNLALIGNAYDGIGIPDCVRQAENAAAAVLLRCGVVNSSRP